MIIDITDSTGTTSYGQDQVGFLNGNAVNIGDWSGAYADPRQMYSFGVIQGSYFNDFLYTCIGQNVVQAPTNYPQRKEFGDL